MIITFGTSTSPIDPGSIEDVIEQLKRDVNAKVSAGTLNAALTSVRTDMELGDEMNKVTLTEEEEEGHSRCYVLRQGGIKLGEIHIDTILKNAYLEKEDDNTYLVLEFEGQADPIKINVNDLIEVGDP